MLTAMTWLASGPDAVPTPKRGRRIRMLSALCGPGSSRCTRRRSKLSSTARRRTAELDEVDHVQAMALLIGPLILGRLSTLADFDYRSCAEAAVDGFLATHAEEVSAASSESAGA